MTAASDADPHAALTAGYAEIARLLREPARIPGLAPWGLDLVPAHRLDPATGHEDPAWRREWLAWRQAVKTVRAEIHERFAASAAFRAEEIARCRRDPAWFVVMWLSVEEPRADLENLTADGDIDPIKPFVPYAPQVRLIQLFVAIVSLPAQFDLLVDKARGFGISFTFLAVCYWGWLFRHWRGRFLSQKLEKTDRALDLDSLFGKIDLFIERTPDEFIPAGFNRPQRGRARQHRLEAMFKNPDTGAQLTAEATTGDSVRGGRATYVCNDEAAFQQNYRGTRATIVGATHHRIDWSSASFKQGRQWYDVVTQTKKLIVQRAERGLPPISAVVEVEWYENPYQDAAWKDREQARFEADGNAEEFEVEYLRNPFATSARHVYPQVHDCPDTSEGFDPHRTLYASVDPGMADDCAWVFWQTHFPGGKKRVRWLDSFVRNRLPAEWYAHVFTGIPPQPEDEAWAYRHDFEHPEVARVAAWLRAVPSSLLTIYGDPAIAAQDSGASSFRQRFILTSQRIADRAGTPQLARYIHEPFTAIYRRNNHPDRRAAMRKALMVSEFSLSDGAQALKEDVGQVVFGDMTERTSLAPRTRHTRHTHRTTAAEFGMVYDDLLLTEDDIRDSVAPPHPRRDRRERLSGRPNPPVNRQRGRGGRRELPLPVGTAA